MDTENFPADAMIGRQIGVYRLERELGRGGMGAVYLADRVDGEFNQTVAIKLIKRGMDTDLILKRFRRERQILAALNHTNIAYFLGGGSTEDGLPYYVMEYIEGDPLYRYCDENHLNIKERLLIFRQICSAVDAAHAIQVIHRDLKPSNILVKPDGKPKLLDFGIAKALDPDLMATDIDPTATQMRLMTPEYAAPEQVSGDAVTPATDIYSLGVVLYELLTGHRPYRLKRHIPHEVARVICEEDPQLPSGSIVRDEDIVPTAGGEKASLKTVVDARGASVEVLRRELSGDLDKIILKTLRKDPRERYRSAAELADDITNFLEGRPVRAEFFAPTTKPLTGRSAKVSVAVLPLKMLNRFSTGDTGDEFLGIGLADALISRLSGVQRLIVRPTSSILPFSDEEPFLAGQKLGVDYVLDGNIRRAGNRIRVSMQLLDVAENSTWWAKAFDEELIDVLDLEDLISGTVATALLPQLTGDERKRLEKRGTNKPEAYEAYLRGRYFWSRFTDEGIVKSVEAFQRAIELDPDYALPYVGIADFYNWAAIFGQIPTQQAFPEAQKAARRALEIDGTLGEAYAVLAFSTLLYEWNWTAAEQLVKRALEFSPNYSFAHECYSNHLVSQGRFEEGLLEIKRAEELDPVAPKSILMTAWTTYQTRHFRESVAKARKGGDMQDNFAQGMLHLGNALTQVGRTDEAILKLQESSRLWDSGLPKYMLCFALAANGQKEDAQEVLDSLLKAAETGYMKPYFIAMCYVAVGDYDKAFEWFEKAFEEQSEWLIWFGTEPKLDPIRKDPRYLDLLKRTRNPIYHQQAQPSETQNTGDREKSIAVLPFKIIGGHNTGDTGEEYLSIGLADALTMRLSNVRRFLVRPTSSVLPFATRVIDPFAAGRELGVEFVIDGNIRHIGDRIRVTAQLLEVGENSTRWSESFDENFTDVLELEDSISEKVTSSLIPHLTGEERRKLAKRGTDNHEAYEAYLRGRYFWNQLTPEAFGKAFSSFQRAVELDPKYAQAYVGSADFYSWSCIFGLIPPLQAGPKALEAADQAIEIDDTLAEAYAAKGLYYSNTLNWAECEKNHRHAISLNPNYPLAHEWLSALLVGTGRTEEGIQEIHTAERLDPLSVRAKVLTAWTIYQTRDFATAIAKANEIIDLDPRFMQGHLQLANSLLEIDRPVEALEAVRTAVEISGGLPLALYVLCFALVANGKEKEARDILLQLIEASANTYVSPYFVGMCHIAVGDIDNALACLKASCEEFSPWIIWIGTEPKMDSLRDDQRFIDLLRSINVPIISKQ
jgi:serine/threonine protein kinase/tetratricopeptide (TPR) repeat protein